MGTASGIDAKPVTYKSRKGTVLHYHIVENSEKPVVVLIHNMWGSHNTFHRHVKVLTEAGYTCVTFNLYQGSTVTKEHSYSRWNYFNYIYRNWIHQITDVLDSIPGKKIVFSLSGPSISALIVASDRKDIDRYICDGGPFKEFWQCTYRMFKLEKKIQSPITAWCFTTLSCLYWGPFAFRRLSKALARWNPTVPILSIRGKLDPIVYPENIDHVFAKHSHINVRVHTIDKGHHLDGLKNFPEEYVPALFIFLKD